METKSFEEWAIVELFGHKKMSGRVSEQAVGGCSFVRIDVPKTKAAPAWTKLLGQGSIYGITITDEITARLCAESYNPEPIDRWEFSHMMKALPEANTPDDDMVGTSDIDEDEDDCAPF